MSDADNQHPISLREMFFLKSVVEAIPGHEPNEKRLSVPPVNNIQVEQAKDKPGEYTVFMRTVVNPDKDKGSPYFVDMECLAVLEADATLSPEEARRGVTITAHSVLFGAIREAVAWISSRQPYGPLTLGLSVLKPKSNGQLDKPVKTEP